MVFTGMEPFFTQLGRVGTRSRGLYSGMVPSITSFRTLKSHLPSWRNRRLLTPSRRARKQFAFYATINARLLRRNCGPLRRWRDRLNVVFLHQLIQRSEVFGLNVAPSCELGL